MSKTRVIRQDSARDARKARTKAKVASLSRPKLTVFRSSKYIYAQIVSLASGHSLAGVRGKNPEEVGTEIAKKGNKLGVKEVVFDRGAYRYHGKIKKLAEKAREGGLEF